MLTLREINRCLDLMINVYVLMGLRIVEVQKPLITGSIQTTHKVLTFVFRCESALSLPSVVWWGCFLFWYLFWCLVVTAEIAAVHYVGILVFGGIGDWLIERTF